MGLLAALLLACAALSPAAAQTDRRDDARVEIGPLLGPLERMVHVEMGNRTIREAFAELARVGGIAIVVRPAVREDLRVTALLTGLTLGDAMAVVCTYTNLQLLPGDRCVIVAPQPTIAVGMPGAGMQQPALPNLNPWQAWFELGLPLVPSGKMGYPKRMAGSIACVRCQLPLQAGWAFCPRCGQQNQPADPHGRYCQTCGKPWQQTPAAAPRAGAAPGAGAGPPRKLQKVPLR